MIGFKGSNPGFCVVFRVSDLLFVLNGDTYWAHLSIAHHGTLVCMDVVHSDAFSGASHFARYLIQHTGACEIAKKVNVAGGTLLQKPNDRP